ncbi:hypothetical protein EIP86_009978 [Pleurotus ostreatoroseus]|nr:hypothetical protein EIP86_009978 [Pleurotus ostreatoroseus]
MKTTSAKRKSASSSSTRQTRSKSKTAAKIAVPKATARKTVGSNAPRKHLDDPAEDTQVPVCRGTRSATGSDNNTDRVKYTDSRTTLTQTTTDAQSRFTGLYLKGQPLYPNGLPVIPRQSVGPSERFNLDPMLVIVLCLNGISISGTPASWCPEMLARKYSHCTGNYKHVVITYDLTNRDQFDKDVAKQMRGVRSNFVRCAFFLVTHSNRDTGDLEWHAGTEDDEASGLSTDIVDLFGAFGGIMKAIEGMDTMLFLLACGAAVTVPNAMSRVQSVVDKYKITRFFGFGHPRLQIEYTNDFISNVLDRVFLRTVTGPQGKTAREVNFQYALSQSRTTGEHTSIHLFQPGMSVEVFTWHQTVMRPSGQCGPMQCPGCMGVYIWRSQQRATQVKMTCRQCEYTLYLERSPTAILYDNKNTGNWYKDNA